MKDDSVYLRHILDAAKRIHDYTQDGQTAFLADTKTQDAVVRNIEIIGEAVKNLSAALRAAHTDIPWKSIAGMRDEVIHHYFGVELDTVWHVVQLRLPVFVKQVERILAGLATGAMQKRNRRP